MVRPRAQEERAAPRAAHGHGYDAGTRMELPVPVPWAAGRARSERVWIGEGQG